MHLSSPQLSHVNQMLQADFRIGFLLIALFCLRFALIAHCSFLVLYLTLMSYNMHLSSPQLSHADQMFQADPFLRSHRLPRGQDLHQACLLQV